MTMHHWRTSTSTSPTPSSQRSSPICRSCHRRVQRLPHDQFGDGHGSERCPRHESSSRDSKPYDPYRQMSPSAPQPRPKPGLSRRPHSTSYAQSPSRQPSAFPVPHRHFPRPVLVQHGPAPGDDRGDRHPQQRPGVPQERPEHRRCHSCQRSRRKFQRGEEPLFPLPTLPSFPFPFLSPFLPLIPLDRSPYLCPVSILIHPPSLSSPSPCPHRVSCRP